jgi:hypothetical protein
MLTDVSVKQRFAALTVSAAALSTLAGCGGDNPAEASAKDNAAASSAPTPKRTSAGAAQLPDAATKHDNAGAVEFVKYYFDQVNTGFATGEYANLVKVSDAGCIICRSTVGDIAFAYANGSIDGGKVKVSDVKAENTTKEYTSLSLKYQTEKYTEVDPDGGSLFSVGSRDLAFIVQLKWLGDHWVMSQITQGTVDKSKG